MVCKSCSLLVLIDSRQKFKSNPWTHLERHKCNLKTQVELCKIMVSDHFQVIFDLLNTAKDQGSQSWIQSYPFMDAGTQQADCPHP